MRQLRVGVLALQGDVAEHCAALEAAGTASMPVRRQSDLDTVEGLVIPGGESTTIGQLVDVFDLRAGIEKRIADGMPVYGSCAGMIMLAETILDGRDDQRPFAGGIRMRVRRNAFGRQTESFETDLSIDGIGDRLVRAVFIRAPWVEDVGEGVKVLATLPGSEPDRIVAVRQGNMLATSFHPELTGDLRMHAYFVSIVRDAVRA